MFKDRPRCPYCSFNPTSRSDYCDEHQDVDYEDIHWWMGEKRIEGAQYNNNSNRHGKHNLRKGKSVCKTK